MRNFIKFLLIIIAIIVFVAIIWASMGLAAPAFLSSFPILTSIFSWAATFVATSPWWMVALAAFGALAVISPESAEEIGDHLGEAANVVGQAAGEVVAGGATGVVDGLLSGGGLALVGLGIVAYFLLTSNSDDEENRAEVVTQPPALPINDMPQPTAQGGYYRV